MRQLSRLQLVLTAALFSTGGAAIKLSTLPAWHVAGLRSGIAAVVLVLLSPRARRGWSRRTLLVALAYAATMILFVLGNRATTAANAVFLQSTAPLYLVFLGPWLLRERTRRIDIVTLVVMLAGLVAILSGGGEAQESAPEPGLGDLYGGLAGLSWALTVLGLRWLARVSGELPTTAVVAGNALTLLIAIPFAFPLTPLETATADDWAVVLWLGVFQIALAYLLLGSGIGHIGALEAALLLLLEPMLSPVWAWALHGEVPSSGAVLGGGLILIASVCRAIFAPGARAGPPAARPRGSSGAP